MAKAKRKKRLLKLNPLAILAAGLFGLALFSVIAKPTSGSKEDASAGEPYSILVVAGQSNAAGAESLAIDPAHGIDVFGDQTVLPADSQVQMLYDNGLGNNSLNKGNLIPLNTLQKLNTSADDTATFGPEVGLARNLYAMGKRRIIILKVAAGGNPLAQDPSTSFDWNVHSTNEMYKILKDRYNLLTDILDSQGAKYNVDGFYWVQGEADVKDGFASQYEQNLRDLISAARTDLSMPENAQFVIGKISSEASIQTHYDFDGDAGCAPNTCAELFALNDEVRAAQQEVADTTPNTRIVDTEPLARTGLQVHLSNVSQLELGKQFAEATELSSSNKLPVQGNSIIKSVEEWQRVYNPNIQPEPFHRDGGSSVRLGNSILWMFGDTFYSTTNADDGHHGRSSTAATAPISDPFNMNEPVDANGAPYQFLPLTEVERQYNADSDTDPADRYIKWPGNAVNISPTEAYVFYQHLKSGGSNAANLGIGIARVQEGQTVATDVNEQLFPGDKLYLPAVSRNGILYLRYCQGIHLNFDQICATAKVSVNQIEDRGSYLFWDGDSWNSDIDTAVFEAPGRGFAMMWSEYLGKYVLFSARSFSGSVTMRTADRPQGPWSDAEYIYSTEGSKYSAIFYAHPELTSEDGKTLVFSFVKQQTVQNLASSIFAAKLTLADGIDNGSLSGGNSQGGGGAGDPENDGPESDDTPGAPLTGVLSRLVVGVAMMVAAGALLASAVYASREGAKKSEK